MTPREYLALVVLPNLAEFDEDHSDPRRAYNAIQSADALAAHIFYWCTRHAPEEVRGYKDDSAFRIDMGRSRANVKLLHDIAKALKHVELNGKSQVRTAAEVTPRPFGYGEGGYGVGPYGGGPQVSVVVDGSKVQISLTLRTAVEFYASELDRLGV